MAALVSIIIRTKNEEKYLGQVLEMMKKQTYQKFEIIVVDNNSTDKTLEIAKKFGCRIINIPEDRFSHPYSCNLGAEYAKGEFLLFTNGHSIPSSDEFIENGMKNFRDKKVAGVYSTVIAHTDGTLTDKIIYNITGYTLGMRRYEAKEFSSGLLGTTNAIIRKDLWEKYKFDENFNGGWGGEDSDWARHFIRLGYKVIHDPKFKVRHSHHLKFKDFFWQIGNWKKMGSSNTTPEKQRKYF